MRGHGAIVRFAPEHRNRRVDPASCRAAPAAAPGGHYTGARVARSSADGDSGRADVSAKE